MSVVTEKKLKLRKDLIELASGLMAGAVSVSLCAPLDTCRTRLNILLSIDGYKGKYHGFFNTMFTIFKEEGVRGLYRGFSLSLLGLPIFNSIYFFSYQKSKQNLRENLLPLKYRKNEDLINMLSAVFAGFLSIIITNPIWVARTRIQTAHLHSVSTKEKYTSIAKTFKTMYREEGNRVFFKGILASIIGLAHPAIYFPIYERLKKYNANENGTVSSYSIMWISIFTKILSTSITFPHVVVRSRLHDSRTTNENDFVTGLKIVKQIWGKEGFRGFFAGLKFDIIREEHRVENIIPVHMKGELFPILIIGIYYVCVKVLERLIYKMQVKYCSDEVYQCVLENFLGVGPLFVFIICSVLSNRMLERYQQRESHGNQKFSRIHIFKLVSGLLLILFSFLMLLVHLVGSHSTSSQTSYMIIIEIFLFKGLGWLIFIKMLRLEYSKKEYTSYYTRAAVLVAFISIIIYIVLRQEVMFGDEEDRPDDIISFLYASVNFFLVVLVFFFPFDRLTQNYKTDGLKANLLNLKDNDSVQEKKPKYDPNQRCTHTDTLFSRDSDRYPKLLNGSRESEKITIHKKVDQVPIMDMSLEKGDKFLDDIMNQIENDVEYKLSKLSKSTVKSDENTRLDQALHADTRIISMDCIGFEKILEGKHETYVYIIEIITEGDEIFYTKKSYSEFLSLCKGIRKLMPDLYLPEFPPKRAKNDDYTQERKEGFAKLVKFFVEQNIECELLREFLRPRDSNDKSRNENLSTFSVFKSVSDERSFFKSDLKKGADSSSPLLQKNLGSPTQRRLFIQELIPCIFSESIQIFLISNDSNVQESIEIVSVCCGEVNAELIFLVKHRYKGVPRILNANKKYEDFEELHKSLKVTYKESLILPPDPSLDRSSRDNLREVGKEFAAYLVELCNLLKINHDVHILKPFLDLNEDYEFIT